MRAIVSGLVAMVLVAATPMPASAGGAVWDFDRDVYHPGEEAIASTGIFWAHNPDLGTPEDGPYRAYAISSAALVGAENPWPSIPEGAVAVGEVEVIEGNVAVVRFVVPDLPDGTYDLLHCNVGCTTTLADITWGNFVIGSPSPTTTTTTVPTTTTSPSTSVPTSTSRPPAPTESTPSAEALALGTTVEEGKGSASPMLLVGGGVLAAATVIAAAVRRRIR